MNFITIVAIIILIRGLYRDFRRDKGQHKKAKAFHAVCISLIVLSYAGSFGKLGWLISHFEGAKEKFSADIGVIPGQGWFLIFLISLFLTLIILVLAYKMINRQEQARRQIIYFLPFLAIIETFNFYRGWLSDGDDPLVSDDLIFTIGFIFFAGITFSMVAIYNSRFMKNFFDVREGDMEVLPVPAPDLNDKI